MPSIYLQFINIALDSFALLVTLIVLVSCVKEYSSNSGTSKYFLLLLTAVAISLVADIIGWFVEGKPYLSTVIIVANTVAVCAGEFAVVFFMGYLKVNLYENSRAASFILKLFNLLCAVSVFFTVGNAFFGYSAMVDANGHWRYTDNIAMSIAYELFPILSFFAIVFMALLAKSSTKINRMVFILYTFFPVAGLIVDYVVHGVSLTYLGLTVGSLVIYTSIYLQKQKMIDAQRNALMLSQINPHFIYNTLSTIAAMCDVSPDRAKSLTIDFSKYLRQNLSNLLHDEMISFDQELSHVECYLKIEKARFRERLNVIYSIQCREFNIPPLTVQPIVENAVKHGITKKVDGGTIKISTYSTDTHHVIEIIDDGVGFDYRDTELHVGLKNVRSRIKAMCKGNISIKSTVGVGTRVTIEIPLE